MDKKDLSILVTIVIIVTIWWFKPKEKITEIEQLSRTKKCLNCNLSTPKRADFSHQTMHGFDLQGSNLANVLFTSSDLRGTNFSDTNLRNADFSNSDLSNANFSNADLRNASFINTHIGNALFENAVYNNQTLGIDPLLLQQAGAVNHDH